MRTRYLKGSRNRLIEEANEVIPITSVLSSIGIEASYSGKHSCPFGDLYHSDGGYDKSLRVYSESNTAYCFRCSTSYTPVSLVSKILGIPQKEAATRLLDLVGKGPKTSEQRWEESFKITNIVDVYSLKAALLLFCERLFDNWAISSLDTDIQAGYIYCLSRLEYIVPGEEDVWLSESKLLMSDIKDRK